ncbi:poly (ADP-ribose) glycohydrolase (macronuclear) [Tetrahymena thermophila SB210]|uniref:Poly (ADP-ribose) glycohydrolase n=1 Tax=Tetrahymena thermophila (strain SB210) TaxID=312017 RepID=I7MMA3_TETTS|nr:poly (ADP-ribose) glycohydrolase [Tetrahymena thermophila SB210]EAS04456.2 poly (ADP-ribose) glycohydrolase [Tetrahymena thermophila SB210]|eukprot:XP_001024701.2 poly (ADP-ribose) glycohydrolase [Tetrahymena thermophila SB210]
MSKPFQIDYSTLLDFIQNIKYKKSNIPSNLKQNLSLNSSHDFLTYEQYLIQPNYDNLVLINPKFDENQDIEIEYSNQQDWFYKNQKQQDKEEWHIIFGSSMFLESVSKKEQAYQICQIFPLIDELLDYIQFTSQSKDFRKLFIPDKKTFYSILIKNIADSKNSFSNVFSIRPHAMENKETYTEKILKAQITLILNCFLKLKSISGEKKVTINTGYIGCGTYNNNHILMALLQFLIADLVGIKKIVFNTHLKSEQAFTAQRIYTVIKNSFKQNKNGNFLQKLPQFLEKINFQCSNSNTQTENQVLNLVNQYLYIILEPSDQLQNNQYGKYPDLNKYINQQQGLETPNPCDQIKMNNQIKEQIQGFQKQEMPCYNNNNYNHHYNNNQDFNQAQMIQNQNQLSNEHIFLKSINAQFQEQNEKKQQNLIYQVEQKIVQDDFQSLNLNAFDQRMIIQISKLLQTKLKKLHKNKQFLYDRFMHKELISQVQHDMLYIRCIQNTPYPPDQLLPNLFQMQKTKFEAIQSEYDYEKNSFNQFQWHVNFADKQLFGFYETSLFAQDEIQTAENPLLYHLREEAVIQAKINPKLQPLTLEDQNPTPILIVNSLRQGKVNTKPTQSNPQGIYGRNFEKADLKKIAEACEQLKEEDIVDVNIISMCSLSYEAGSYTLNQIKFTFNTAYKSFREAYNTVKRLYSENNIPVIINTGNWGTGAFGNNSVLIAIIQLLAAEISQVDVLKYYTFDQKGYEAFISGIQVFQKIKKEIFNYQPKSFSQYVEYFLNQIFNLKYKWSVSDGN